MTNWLRSMEHTGEMVEAGLPKPGKRRVLDETSCRVMNEAIRLHEPFERYKPRALSQAGTWQVGATRFKVYGLLADGKSLTSEIMQDSETFVRKDVATAITIEGAENGVGFVIVHPGDFGVSTSAHWWVQGSVLCQRIRRKIYGAHEPMDVTTRPVIACVWELAIIDAEQKIWRDTMMCEMPNLSAYLNARLPAAFV